MKARLSTPKVGESLMSQGMIPGRLATCCQLSPASSLRQTRPSWVFSSRGAMPMANARLSVRMSGEAITWWMVASAAMSAWTWKLSPTSSLTHKPSPAVPNTKRSAASMAAAFTPSSLSIR